MPQFKSGIFVWTPAPASAQFAVEQLREARNKRTASTHVFLVPRVFTSIWRKQLIRVADVVITLPFIENIWEKSQQHEPLTLAFVFPFLHFSPWQLKRTRAFLEVGWVLQKMWKNSEVTPGPILRKFLLKTRSLESMQEYVVRQVLQSTRFFGFLHHETSK